MIEQGFDTFLLTTFCFPFELQPFVVKMTSTQKIAGINCRKLVLHLDVNDTVFIGDSITKQVTPEAALNEYLVDVAWGKVDETGAWTCDSSRLHEKPPDEESLSYYRYAQAKYRGKPRHQFKAHIRRFTEEEIGKPFRCFYEQMIESLKFPGDLKFTNNVELPSFKDREGVLYHCIVPSFYKLVDYLIESRNHFSIIFRTFGGDGQIALQAASDFLKGRCVNNPQGTHTNNFCRAPVQSPKLEVNFSTGEITHSSDQICLKFPGDVVYSNLQDIYTYLSQSSGIQLVTDDYEWWKAQDFSSSAAKPLLIDPCDDSVHHIIFDDNFRPWEPEDSIVNVLLAKEGSFYSVNPAAFDDICVVKADLYQSICNRNYFIDKIELCERNYSKFLLERKN